MYNLKSLPGRPIHAIWKIFGHTIHKNLVHNPWRAVRKITEREGKLRVKSTWFLLARDDFEDPRQNYITDVVARGAGNRPFGTNRDRIYRGICCRCGRTRKYAIVVDTEKSRSTSMPTMAGGRVLSRITTSHRAQGRRTEGARRGLRKTPLGVYHVVSQVPKKRLTDFYGSGAFPINYPNEYDRLQPRRPRHLAPRRPQRCRSLPFSSRRRTAVWYLRQLRLAGRGPRGSNSA